jgi:hypothetical protein
MDFFYGLPGKGIGSLAARRSRGEMLSNKSTSDEVHIYFLDIPPIDKSWSGYPKNK